MTNAGLDIDNNTKCYEKTSYLDSHAVFPELNVKYLTSGFLLKTEFINTEDSSKNEIHEYNIKLNNVTEQDIKKPDLSNYKLIEF